MAQCLLEESLVDIVETSARCEGCGLTDVALAGDVALVIDEILPEKER